MKEKKGFVLSLAAGALVILLILLITLLHNSYLNSERAIKNAQPIQYSAFFFNNVFADVKEIVGPGTTITKSNGTIIITITDSLPKSDFIDDLKSYKSFLENSFSVDIHANITANFSAIEDGTLELFLLSRYLYNNSYIGNNEVLFGTINETDDSKARNYEITLRVKRHRQSIQDFSWNPSGDTNVTIILTDLNGTWNSSGTLDSSTENMFKATFISTETRTVEVKLGKIETRKGALWIKDTNSSVLFSFLAKIPLDNTSMPISYQYNALLNYSQINITKNDLISNN